MRLPGVYGSAEFLAAYDQALGGDAKAHKSPAAGSFAWGLSMYRQSQAWASLSSATCRQRDNIFARVVKTHGETPIAAWRRGDIAAGRDKRAATLPRPKTSWRACAGSFGGLSSPVLSPVTRRPE